MSIAPTLAVTLKDALRISGLSRSEMYRRLASGEIAARKLGRSTLIEMATLERFIAGLPRAEFHSAAAKV